MIKSNVQLLAVNKNADQEAKVLFTCGLDAIKSILDFVGDIRIKFYLADAKDDVIIGQIVSVNATATSGDTKYKFAIKCPQSENVKTSQLSSLCGQAVDLVIEIDE